MAPANKPTRAWVSDLNEHDVLLGRGQPILNYSGNLRFRKLIASHKATYTATGKHAVKDDIARKILATIDDRGGRFLRKVETDEERDLLGVPESVIHPWLVASETIRLQKVKQALREQEKKESKLRKRKAESEADSPIQRSDAYHKQSPSRFSSVSGTRPANRPSDLYQESSSCVPEPLAPETMPDSTSSIHDRQNVVARMGRPQIGGVVTGVPHLGNTELMRQQRQFPSEESAHQLNVFATRTSLWNEFSYQSNPRYPTEASTRFAASAATPPASTNVAVTSDLKNDAFARIAVSKAIQQYLQLQQDGPRTAATGAAETKTEGSPKSKSPDDQKPKAKHSD